MAVDLVCSQHGLKNCPVRECLVERGGHKDDQDKLRWDLMPSDALTEIVKVMTYGAKKYRARNWEEGMQYSRPFGALMRHCWAWWMGEDKDPETGFSHLSHAGCCVLFLLSYDLRSMVKFDDREPNLRATPGFKED